VASFSTAPIRDAASGRKYLMSDWIEILPASLPVTRAIDFVTDPSAGGIDVFLGMTRCENSAAQAKLVALDYEAYPEMAIQRMQQMAAEARNRWPIVGLAMLHRIGRVAVAEPSVVIAVSCPHRGEAFEACRWLIDQLKADVPIWKKEIWAEGADSWVHPDRPDSPAVSQANSTRDSS
jgi:molybdopterin synthase catalytic subunit